MHFVCFGCWKILINFLFSLISYYFCILFSSNGEHQKGVNLLKTALDLDPHYSEALLSLGKTMMDLHRWSEAEKYFKAAITEKPDFAKAYNFYGVYHFKQGMIQNKLMCF